MSDKSTDNHLKEDKHLFVKPGTVVSLNEFDTNYKAGFKDKDDAEGKLDLDIKRLSDLQDVLYAQDEYSLLIVLQAMDAAGKDSTIKHVMSGVNPQGCDVTSFKQPSAEELAHDYLWRIHKALPPRGKIGIFNRSHYEEVLVVRVHPEYLLAQNIPGIDSVDKADKDFWKRRFEDINNFEKHISNDGVKIIKFFLNVSEKEQKKRFLKRIEEKDKNWKFSVNDLKERALWDKYMKAYEEAINHTSTEYAPWYIIPADNKWFMRAAVGDIIAGTLEEMKLCYPKINDKVRSELDEAKKILLKEGN
jgi:PPK2 family polyphosphate:nucleotide phosphotransferase